ncbi:MAG: pyridoxal phosphate-dependent aminotransferase [Chryseotalea sp.]|jgi:histidinol-phosphate aminotransferase
MKTNRRDWLKFALGSTASLLTVPALAEQLMQAPVSEAERNHKSIVPPGGLIRLGSNENPYGPSPISRNAIMGSMVEANRYSFEVSSNFKKFLAQKEGVTPDHILLGNGSSELLCLAGISLGLERKRVLSPFPVFRLMMDYAEKLGATWDKVPLTENFQIDFPAMEKNMKPDTKMIFVVNPNNPVGTLTDWNAYTQFCENASKSCTVYSDEAYLEFLPREQQRSMVELVKKDCDVLVSRTFSKVYGLAGLRLGYLIGKPERIKEMAKYQMGANVNINQAVLAAAQAALDDSQFIESTKRLNTEARAVLENYLQAKKINYAPSVINLLFFPSPLPGKTMLSKTEEAGFQIRVWDYAGKEWCRVSIGTKAEMQDFVRAFDKIIGV